MKWHLFTIGKCRADLYRELEITFEKRIRKKVGFSKKIFSTETALLKAVPSSAFVILFDERGKRFTSEAFARELERRMMHERRDFVFVIGGAYGFTSALRFRGELEVSLSPMTFPHKLASLIAMEQLYRALTIVHNEPYHH